MSLRYRLWLSFTPLLLLLAAFGIGAVYAFDLVGDRIDGILRENYRSVEAMAGLNEAVERIDSSFQFAAAGQPGAKAQYAGGWVACYRNLEIERNNITEPGEAELVARLAELTGNYRVRGDRFFDVTRTTAERREDYYGANGRLRATFADIKSTSREIRRLTQDSMEGASADARRTAASARWWATLALVASLFVTGWLAWRTTRTVLDPIEDLTRSAMAVGDGHFDQHVVAETSDEIGELVAAFNRMTVQLKDLRQSQSARLIRAQQASQAAIDSFPDPVLVVDPDGRVTMANPAARRILGVIPGDDPAAPPWPAPERLRGPLASALHHQQPYLTQSFDEAVTYRIGSEDRIFVPQVLPVRDPYGNTLGAAVVLNDVTRFRLLDEFKGDLVATASHELKTPLTGLRLGVHLLLEEVVGPLTEKQTELLVDARDNTERLVKIVDHLLSLARLEEGREPITLRPEHPVSLLRASVERIAPMMTGQSVRIDVDPNAVFPQVAADAERLGHALDNLLVNAATYTEPGGQVILSVRSVPGDRVELSIRDTGIGIAAEYLPHLFDKFFRIPGQTRGQGTGLGLAIVKEVVVAHGGEITCESEAGLGTTFRIVLPAWRHG